MKYLLIVLAVLVGLQFFQIPKPSLNETPASDIANEVQIPADVHNLLRTACYDCHSLETDFPWYTYVQPVGWWLGGHMNEGREHLNFSKFGEYSKHDAAHAMEELNEMVHKGYMPLDSYQWLHSEARLTDAQREKISQWAIKTYADMTGDKPE